MKKGCPKKCRQKNRPSAQCVLDLMMHVLTDNRIGVSRKHLVRLVQWAWFKGRFTIILQEKKGVKKDDK